MWWAVEKSVSCRYTHPDGRDPQRRILGQRKGAEKLALRPAHYSISRRGWSAAG